MRISERNDAREIVFVYTAKKFKLRQRYLFDRFSYSGFLT